MTSHQRSGTKKKCTWMRRYKNWSTLLKIEISSIAHCCFSISQNELKFNCSYMARSSLTYILGFSVKFIFQPIYTDYASFWLILKQQWTIEEISIFSNSSHPEWRVELSDTILKWDYPKTTPAKSEMSSNLTAATWQGVV
jgi:hypothetical protein